MIVSEAIRLITDKATLLKVHCDAQDELAAIKREFMQERASYEQLSNAAFCVVEIRQQIERVKFGKVQMTAAKARQMQLGLMR